MEILPNIFITPQESCQAFVKLQMDIYLFLIKKFQEEIFLNINKVNF